MAALAGATRWRGEGGQHQGGRPYQEDSWEARTLADGAMLAVVCDGMGGHAGGALASKTAVAAFVKSVAKEGKSLKDGLLAANEAVRKAGKGKPDLAGMGCTLVGVRVSGGEASWISVGDSPFFLIAGGKVTRLNADHSMAPQIDALVARGAISKEEAEHHPARHTLREAVMGEEIVLIDEGKRTLAEGEKLLICSDGVQTLDDAAIGAKAGRPVQGLIDAVLAAKKKHQDNITVVLLERET